MKTRNHSYNNCDQPNLVNMFMGSIIMVFPLGPVWIAFGSMIYVQAGTWWAVIYTILLVGLYSWYTYWISAKLEKHDKLNPRCHRGRGIAMNNGSEMM